MYFQHTDAIWSEHPSLVAGAISVTGITAEALVDGQAAKFQAIAEARLAAATESDLPEIRAWRRAYATMGLKPTQYRCAAEALLRRLRKQGDLPSVNPLVDLCNAISVAFAIPIAVFDLAAIADYLEVRPAAGNETYLTFAGEIENPAPHEVIFADAAGRAHARRWSNRQSGLSAVRPTSSQVLIVAEALHASAAADIAEVTATLIRVVDDVWPAAVATGAVLTQTAPRFTI